jgi:riboflavin synthase
MFTGIIEDVGTIIGIDKSGGKWEFHVKSALLPPPVAEGDSVAIDGVCLTATKIRGDVFSADASLETLSLTTLKEKKAGERINVERAMRSDGRFGGHMVMGHVDGMGTITGMKKEGDSIRLEVEVEADLSRYIVKKGSIAIDGISLTVNEQRDNIFFVNIIPYTASRATIGGKNLRDRVNIETDIVGKYIERFIVKGQRKGIDLNFLYSYGYIKGE